MARSGVMVVSPVDWSMCEANCWITSLGVHKESQVTDHVSANYHMRIEADDVVTFGMFDGGFSGREETRERLAMDTEDTFSNITGGKDGVQAFVDSFVGVVADNYLTITRTERLQLLKARPDGDR